MEPHKTRKQLSMLDKFGAALSDRAVDRISRRHLFYRLAAGAAGMFSVGITASSIINIGGRVYAQSNPSPPPPCAHNGTGIATDSTYCGLHGVSCADLRSCVGTTCTWVGACPKGTSPAGPSTPTGTYPWRACCLCSGGDGDTGEIFMYQDCCGTQTSGFLCGTKINACSATHYHNAGNRCPRQMNWCDPFPNSGTYYCTVALGPQGTCSLRTFCDCIDD
jgi:hypothetical protein